MIKSVERRSEELVKSWNEAEAHGITEKVEDWTRIRFVTATESS